MGKLLKLIFGSIVGRWVTASLIALLLGGLGWKWHQFKEGLIHQGTQVCVQEINRQTVIDLEAALAAERATSAELVALAEETAAINANAKQRLVESELTVAGLEKAMAEQEEQDETYKAWRNSDLPAGVGERLRSVGAGSDPSAVRNDSN